MNLLKRCLVSVTFLLPFAQACKPREYNESESKRVPNMVMMAKEGNKGALLWVDTSLSVAQGGQNMAPHLRPSQCWYYLEVDDVDNWGPKGVSHFFKMSRSINQNGVSPDAVHQALYKSTQLQQIVGSLMPFLGLAVGGAGVFGDLIVNFNGDGPADPHFTKAPGGKLYAVTSYGEKLTENQVFAMAESWERYISNVEKFMNNPPPGATVSGTYMQFPDGKVQDLRISIEAWELIEFRDILKNNRAEALNFGKEHFRNSFRRFAVRMSPRLMIGAGISIMGGGFYMVIKGQNEERTHEKLQKIIASPRDKQELSVSELKIIRDAVALVGSKDAGLNCADAKYAAAANTLTQ